MRGTKAKRLRRENPETKPKQYGQPKMMAVPTGEVGEDGRMKIETQYIPRRQRRAILRHFTTAIRKGKIKL